VTFRQRPYLVAAIVEPFFRFLLFVGGEVFDFQLHVDESIRVISERHLDAASTQLGHDGRCHPLV
jgi:hypothetical protein